MSKHRFLNVIVLNINKIEFLTSASSSTPQRSSTPMERLTRWMSLFILIISLCHFQTSEACSCLFKHPQAHFCDSDFVTVVNVTNFWFPNAKEVVYIVKVLKILKATQNARIALERKFVWLSSTSMDSECPPLDLTSGMIWVVSGRMVRNTLSISPCDFGEQWSMLSHTQREGFHGLYHRGCACPISDGKLHQERALGSAGEKRCLRESSFGPRDCQEQFATCISSSTGCSWVLSRNYASCIANHGSFRVQRQLHQHP